MGMWRIPDGSAPAFREITVKIPTGSMWASRFWGAFLLLCYEWNWEATDTSTMTPEEAAALWQDGLFDGEQNGVAMVTGTIIYFAGVSIPSGWLVCNAALLSKTVYPGLFAVIGYTYGGSGDNFQLPSLVERFPLGPSIAYPIGSTGGLKTHTLTESEMPEHTHPLPEGVDSGGIVFQGWKRTLRSDAWGATGSSGGGEPHNNMPPFIALYPIIKT